MCRRAKLIKENAIFPIKINNRITTKAVRPRCSTSLQKLKKKERIMNNDDQRQRI